MPLADQSSVPRPNSSTDFPKLLKTPQAGSSSKPSWIGPLPPSRPFSPGIPDMKTSVKLSFSSPGLKAPVYIVTSLSQPQWHPVEMEYIQQADGELKFSKDFEAEEGQYQYKFRLGPGDWWALDESKPSVDDGSGNRNNVIDVEPHTIAVEQPAPIIPQAKAGGAASEEPKTATALRPSETTAITPQKPANLDPSRTDNQSPRLIPLSKPDTQINVPAAGPKHIEAEEHPALQNATRERRRDDDEDAPARSSLSHGYTPQGEPSIHSDVTEHPPFDAAALLRELDREATSYSQHQNVPLSDSAKASDSGRLLVIDETDEVDFEDAAADDLDDYDHHLDTLVQRLKPHPREGHAPTSKPALDVCRTGPTDPLTPPMTPEMRKDLATNEGRFEPFATENYAPESIQEVVDHNRMDEKTINANPKPIETFTAPRDEHDEQKGIMTMFKGIFVGLGSWLNGMAGGSGRATGLLALVIGVVAACYKWRDIRDTVAPNLVRSVLPDAHGCAADLV